MKLKELVEVFNATVKGNKAEIYWKIKSFKNCVFMDSHGDLKKEKIDQYLLEGDVMNIHDITVKYRSSDIHNSFPDLYIEVLINLL